MREEDIYKKLFGFGSSTTYYSWKKDENKRLILKLLSKYFSKDDLEEYLSSGEITKFNTLKNYEYIQRRKAIEYLSLFKKTEFTPQGINSGFIGLEAFHTETIEMYIDFLDYLSNSRQLVNLNHSFLKFISEENSHKACFERYDYTRIFNFLINNDFQDLLFENVKKDFLPIIELTTGHVGLQEEALYHAILFVCKKYNLDIEKLDKNISVDEDGLFSLQTYNAILEHIKEKSL